MGLSKNIAYRLWTLREASKLSQQEVAKRADLSLSLVAKMEQGRKADPRASTLLALADALGVKPGQLIEDLTPPPEGFFTGKEKKGKKKKKKQSEELAVPTDGAAPLSVATPGGLVVATDALGLNAEDGKDRKKKKKKEK